MIDREGVSGGVGEDLLERSWVQQEEASLPHVQKLIEQLDRDWKLGLFEGTEVSWDLLGMQRELLQSQASFQDGVDLGVAFLTMEAWEMASAWFSQFLHRLWKDPENSTALLNVTALFVRSLMGQKKFFEALSEMQRLLQDDEIDHSKKIELFYLAARIHEALGQSAEVQRYEGYVLQMDAHYRDMRERSKKK